MDAPEVAKLHGFFGKSRDRTYDKDAMIDNETMMARFDEVFGGAPVLIARAPGRINLIGEHTDYNGGLVLPAAINREIKMAARARKSGPIRLFSENYGEEYSFYPVDELSLPAAKGWHSFFMAVADQFARRGAAVPPMDVFINGDVPLSAGLSSSAAYEVCAAVLLSHVCGTNIGMKQLALLAQAAEHSPFVGVRCGIMDQFASALGCKDHALLVDCHTLECEAVPFSSKNAAIVIVNSMKQRELRASEYNQRRRECEDGLKKICAISGHQFPTVRHIPMSVFSRYTGKLSENERKRLRHNLTENQRVLDFVAALRADDWRGCGNLLCQSHESLRDDYDVSCAELDRIVEIARNCDGVYGCRMTGAGFGGCAVALVTPGAVDDFSRGLSAEYEKEFTARPGIYVSTPADGANAAAPSKGDDE